MQLRKFRDDFLESLLEFLWCEWSAIGVAGYSKRDKPYVIDPEALLLFSSTFARYDQRLFDEILDWLVCNERFINVQRLKAMASKEQFQNFKVIKAMAGTILRSKNGLKWKKIALNEEKEHSVKEHLFYLKDNSPLPVVGEIDKNYSEYGLLRNPLLPRQYSKSFPQGTTAGFQLQLRGFMGVNSRSEILLYLLLNKKASVKDLTQQTYYTQKSVQDVIFEMSRSSLLYYPEVKRGRTYQIDPVPWLSLFLNHSDQVIKWVGWGSLFRALEIIWLMLNEPDFLKLPEFEQIMIIREIMNSEVHFRLDRAGFNREFSSIRNLTGEEYLDAWIMHLKKILSEI